MLFCSSGISSEYIIKKKELTLFKLKQKEIELHEERFKPTMFTPNWANRRVEMALWDLYLKKSSASHVHLRY